MNEAPFPSTGQGVVVMAHSVTAAAREYNVAGLVLPRSVPVRVEMDGVDTVIGTAVLAQEVDGSVTAKASLLCSSMVFAMAYVNEEMWEFIGWSPRYEREDSRGYLYLRLVSIYITDKHDEGCYLTLF